MSKRNTPQDENRAVFIILFWGALWGLAEATLGHVLHAAAAAIPGLQGFVMFPIAFALMERAVAASGKPWAAFAASWVAAAVKLADFLVPGAVPLRVLNPAAALLMEGAAVWAALAWCGRRQVRVGGWHGLAASLLWRVLFLGDQLVLAMLAIPAGLVTNGWMPALQFLLVEGAVNAVLIAGWLAVASRWIRFARPDPAPPQENPEDLSFPESIRTGSPLNGRMRVPLAVWSGGLLMMAVVAQLLL